MSPNFNTPIPAARGITGEGWAAIAGAIGSAFLLVKKLASPRSAKPEAVSRAEFCAEMLATRERFHTNHLAMLEKLDANHRELLTALERLATRISTLEAGLARLDERTKV
jgi:predicted RNase H-like nuclease (RuvC/YqgF family)